MIAILDYGAGNLRSVELALARLHADAVVTSDAEVAMKADGLILPGVGAFKDAADKLRKSGLDKILIEKAKAGCPVLGICLGMQLLFEKSFEYGEHKGLGLLKGDIVPFKGAIDDSLKIPHIGWNAITKRDDCPLFKYVKNGDFVYFVHSFYADFDTHSKAAWSDYGVPFTAAVWDGNIFGCQFHPEKSGDVGLNILRAFIEIGEN